MTIVFIEPDTDKEEDTDRWEEFRVDSGDGPIAMKYCKPRLPAGPSDINGHGGLLYCKVCPSCKYFRSRPVFLDVQCHSLELMNDGFCQPRFGRIGDWSPVHCDDCYAVTKWGNWHDDDMLPRPRETVFHDGSECYSYRTGAEGGRCAFVARERKSDGTLIWKKDPLGTKAIRSKLIPMRLWRARETLIEKALDMPYFEYVKHNMLVRTRTDAARTALASI